MRRSKFSRKPRPVARNCYFCENHIEPDYKDTTILSKYLTERGKILGKSRTGLCSKHQRAVQKAVKYARHIALLPFVVRA
jgi:small subunit ribosomal protein S18